MILWEIVVPYSLNKVVSYNFLYNYVEGFRIRSDTIVGHWRDPVDCQRHHTKLEFIQIACSEHVIHAVLQDVARVFKQKEVMYYPIAYDVRFYLNEDQDTDR